MALRNGLLGVGALAMLMLTSSKLTALVLLMVPVVIGPIVVFGRRVRKLALQRIRGALAPRLAAQGVEPAEAARIADELSLFALAVADGTFIQEHIDPRGTDVRRIFEHLDRALEVLVRERAAGGR